ncbi:YopT-type cysteine protease domain-containing protein [Scandinavium sp. H11S7]|uniref:YopT-type cysteine protease domain-containing protein n=1 Tax=Scandinavium hiltneri TaxID=2926519 RepID=A0ABT2E3M7_9ENTR|nr:YopT-type cysteine protease domain-containing protein [Scandinavium hiltneri]MCS2155929.1 YopT-type cysteine protease domain-containing protein [Scandinavium hiltneri]MCS2162455.1 YopT-type cysteine protease domain-containing protein [Scandinavium hiltneri]
MKIDKFFQDSYIRKNKNTFGSKCDGVCTGLSLTWIEANVKHGEFKNHVKQPTITQKVSEYQNNYATNPFSLLADGNQEDSSVFAKIAYEDGFRRWGQKTNYILTRVEGSTGGVGEKRKCMLNELVWSMTSMNAGSVVYGIVLLMGEKDGHAMAWTQQNRMYDFFDPNFGIYSDIKEEKLFNFISSHIKKHYKKLNYTWTTAKFTKLLTSPTPRPA